MVHNLDIAGEFVEYEQSNTFAVNFSWEPPSFKYNQVAYYNVSCHFSGYPRDEFQSYTKTNLVSIKSLTKFKTMGCLKTQLSKMHFGPIFHQFWAGFIMWKERSTPKQSLWHLKGNRLLFDPLTVFIMSSSCVYVVQIYSWIHSFMSYSKEHYSA